MTIAGSVRRGWYAGVFSFKGDRAAITAYVALLAGEHEGLDLRTIPSENHELYESTRRDLALWVGKEGAPLPDWTQLCLLEMRLTLLLSIDGIRMKIPLVRERLRQVAGTDADAFYERIVPLDDKMPEPVLRERLKVLLSEFHLHRRTWSRREKSRLALTWLAGFGIVLGAVLGYVLTKLSVGATPAIHFGPFPPSLIMGAIGGFVSMYLRMQTVDLRAPAFAALLDSRYGQASIVIAPVFGAVFAGLLLLLFAGGFIQGQLFPRVVPEGSNFAEFFLKTKADGPSEMVRLLIWSFVAGFAERLVPNVLNRLAAEADRPKDRPV